MFGIVLTMEIEKRVERQIIGDKIEYKKVDIGGLKNAETDISDIE